MNIFLKRIISYAIDYFILLLFHIPSFMFFWSSMGKEELELLPLQLSFFALFVLKDFFGGRSIGKRIMGIEIVFDSPPKSIVVRQLKYTLRNITLILGIVELIVLIVRKDQKRIGDILAGTRVGD